MQRNLALCFPELTSAAIDALSKKHFEALGESLAESAFAWFAPAPRLDERYRIGGLENLHKALKLGKGVVLYTGHFTTLEICGLPFRHITPRFACMFSHRSNELLDEIQRRGRMRFAHELIPSDSVRALLRSLGRNAVVWYAPDQFHAGGEPIRFFHESAMTNVATGKLAGLSGATVIPFSYRRLDRQGTYELLFHPPLADFPSDRPAHDARRLVECLEQFIRLCPEQYLWVHKRFKDRPAEFPDLYRTEDRPVASD